MAEIYREVTEWIADYKVCNHTYLFVNSDSIIAYVNEKDGTVHRLNSPLKISKSKRKFVKTQHPELSKLAKYYENSSVNKNTKRYKVKSKDKEYIVENTEGKYKCTCQGYNFRGKCKHITAVIEQESN